MADATKRKPAPAATKRAKDARLLPLLTAVGKAKLPQLRDVYDATDPRLMPHLAVLCNALGDIDVLTGTLDALAERGGDPYVQETESGAMSVNAHRAELLKSFKLVDSSLKALGITHKEIVALPATDTAHNDPFA